MGEKLAIIAIAIILLSFFSYIFIKYSIKFLDKDAIPNFKNSFPFGGPVPIIFQTINMVDVISITLAILVIIILTYIYWFYYFFTYWERKGVVSITPEFPFGNAKSLIFQKSALYQYSYEIYNKLKKLNKRFGGHYLFYIPDLFIIDPELIKRILITDFKYFQNRGMHCNESYDPLNCSIICLENDKWKSTRMKLSPAFTSGKMKLLFNTFQMSIEKLDEVLEEKISHVEAINIRDVIFRGIMDNLGRAVFGLECNMLKDPNSEFFKISQSFFDTTLSNMWLLGAGMYSPKLLDFFKIPITSKKVSEFFSKIIKDTVTYRLENYEQNSTDFMGLFIKLMKKPVDENGTDGYLSYNEVAAHTFAFFAAGFETSASTITFCLLELAYNKNIQNKLRHEILTVLAKNNGEFTYDTISEMNYLDKVICETLRKYPTLSFVQRKCNETYIIPETNVKIEPGTGIWISPFALHNDPEYYPDPVKFDPERFSEEEKAKRHPFAYIPFGEGPRICIGKRFALLQVKLTITKLLSKYHFDMDLRTRYPVEFNSHGIFLGSKHIIWLRIKKLNQNK